MEIKELGIECDLGWKLKVPTKSLSAACAVKKSTKKNTMTMMGCVGSAGMTT
jgi:hypothetical protein